MAIQAKLPCFAGCCGILALGLCAFAVVTPMWYWISFISTDDDSPIMRYDLYNGVVFMEARLKFPVTGDCTQEMAGDAESAYKKSDDTGVLAASCKCGDKESLECDVWYDREKLQKHSDDSSKCKHGVIPAGIMSAAGFVAFIGSILAFVSACGSSKVMKTVALIVFGLGAGLVVVGVVMGIQACNPKMMCPSENNDDSNTNGTRLTLMYAGAYAAMFALVTLLCAIVLQLVGVLKHPTYGDEATLIQPAPGYYGGKSLNYN